MKKLNRFLSIILLLVLFTSCGDDWLKPEPLSLFAPETIFVDEQGLEGLLLVCRKNLRFDHSGPFMSAIVMENVLGDGFVTGTPLERSGKNWPLQLSPTTTTQENYNNYWNNWWENIKAANSVISKIDMPEWNSEADKNAILAEGYWHRAFAYYRLILQFGEVPFLEREYTEPKIDFYTHSRKAVINRLQRELEFAVQWLPDDVLRGKVNRAAGNMLLAKVALLNSDFDLAIKATSDIINDNRYALMNERFGRDAADDRLNHIWDLHQKENKNLAMNTEAILVSQDRHNLPGVSTTARTGGNWSMRIYLPLFSNINDPDGQRATFMYPGDRLTTEVSYGWAQNRPTNYSQYIIWQDSGDDLRHCTDTNWMTMTKVWVNHEDSEYKGQFLQESWKDLYMTPVDTIRAWFGWPHYKLFTEDENVPDVPAGGHTPWYVYRLAEVYLTRAEAYYYKGQLEPAAADINKIRERANAPLITAEDVTLEYVFDERARELTAEEPRKSELTRAALILADNNWMGYSTENFHDNNWWYHMVSKPENGYYNQGVVQILEYRIAPHNVFWPIPQRAIDDNTGGHINQNIGYPGAGNNIPSLTTFEDEE